MGLVTFGINLTLDGCYDHQQMAPDDELLDYWTQLSEDAGAVLYGRVTYELMESAWPQLVHDEQAPAAMRRWARMLDAKRKYVVSSTRRQFSWRNSVHVAGELAAAVTRLRDETPRGLLVGGPRLAAALEALGLIDEYRFVVHPMVAGRGPTLLAGLAQPRQLELVASERLSAGVLALHYRRPR